MIQRIQTLYLLIPIICLVIVQAGGDIFYLIGENMYALNAYGIVDNMPTADVKLVKSFPLFLVIVLLIVLTIVTIFSYKKLKNQLKLVKLIIIIYGLSLLGLMLLFFLNINLLDRDAEFTYQFGSAMYFIIFGFPALFLAIQGIKKDLNLLDSLNRLR